VARRVMTSIWRTCGSRRDNCLPGYRYAAGRRHGSGLYARASFALDAGLEQGADFARTFTPDGVLVRSGAPTNGRAALTAAAAGAAANPVLHHWLTNLTIEPSPDGAVGRVYVLNLLPGNAATAVNDVGHFDDQLVRTTDGWRFSRRVYTSELAKAPAVPLAVPAGK